MKVGDKAIVVKCNYYDADYKYKTSTVVEIDPAGLKKGTFVFPHRVRLWDGYEVWCRAIPCSSLIEELM